LEAADKIYTDDNEFCQKEENQTAKLLPNKHNDKSAGNTDWTQHLFIDDLVQTRKHTIAEVQSEETEHHRKIPTRTPVAPARLDMDRSIDAGHSVLGGYRGFLGDSTSILSNSTLEEDLILEEIQDKQMAF
jgi:hypothetical protein